MNHDDGFFLSDDHHNKWLASIIYRSDYFLYKMHGYPEPNFENILKEVEDANRRTTDKPTGKNNG